MIPFTRSTLVMGLLASLTSLAFGQYTYTTIDAPGAGIDTVIGGAPGGTYPTAINNAGQIVGYYVDSNNGLHGFLYSGGTFTTIDYPGSGDTNLWGINNYGDIVGDRNNQGFLYSGGNFSDIVDPLQTQNETIAYGINDPGQIVGFFPYFPPNAPATGWYGFIDSAGTFTSLNDPLDGVCGYSPTICTPLYGINNTGEIVGRYWNGSAYIGFLYSGGTFTDVPGSASVYSINNLGQMVGLDSTGATFVYSNGGFTTLNDPLGGIPGNTQAYGINDSGIIVGSWFDGAKGLNRGFIAQPTKTSQTITFGALSNKVFGAAPFAVSATASSGLTVSFASLTSSVCGVSGSTVSLVAVGTCTIQATQSGNTTYAAATPVSQSFQVTKASQTITFGAISSKTFGTSPFTISATASSGLAVSFTSQTTSICTVSGPRVTLVAVGTCTIQATQAGNANYAAATPVNQSFQVTQAKTSQTITFGALSNKVFGNPPFTVSATASSGLTVSFNSQTTSVCKVSGATVTLTAAGTCTIQATQAGNSTYAAATPVSRSFQVTKASQTITFGALSNRSLAAGSFTVSATASSGLSVSFTSTTTTVCTVSRSRVTLVAVGTCTIQAAQSGNSNYAAATPVKQSFQVTP